MLSLADAIDYVSDLEWQPGYRVWVEHTGTLWAQKWNPNAWRSGSAEQHWWWSAQLRPEDLADEISLFRRVIGEVLRFDLHEHLEFTGIIDAHRDPADVEITCWPVEVRHPYQFHEDRQLHEEDAWQPPNSTRT